MDVTYITIGWSAIKWNAIGESAMHSTRVYIRFCFFRR
ncbi:hypothetical protein D805_0767 [Bifidobacterium thermophilum RBL67]|uniref:Uncharacterized protein n=1 Tax=Bifidobacterium thermophilum RBL67 TaxID=1254439 RepID=M4RFT5_9BIFI|nr:hypothetical protein D805_0767 [Bifidobacterium thermophilum RBL67]